MICDFDVCYRTSYRLRVGRSRFDKIDELPNTTPMTIDDALRAGSHFDFFVALLACVGPAALFLICTVSGGVIDLRSRVEGSRYEQSEDQQASWSPHGHCAESYDSIPPG